MCAARISSSCSPTSASAARCTRSSARARWRPCSRSKPEERRELVEEAAGLGKFKRRKHRAELKLNRVGIQVERARDVEAEVRKRLRPLALQATAAERAEKLAVEVAGLPARVAELDLATAEARRAEVEERKTAAALGRRSAHERLAALLAERQAAEEELADAAGRREAAVKALYRLQGAAERVALRQEGAAALLMRLQEGSERRRVGGGRTSWTTAVAHWKRRLRRRRPLRALLQRRAAPVRSGRGRRRSGWRRSSAVRPPAPRSASTACARSGRCSKGSSPTLRVDARARRKRFTGWAAAGSASPCAANRRRRFARALRSELAEAEAAARRSGPTPDELEAAANEATALRT